MQEKLDEFKLGVDEVVNRMTGDVSDIIGIGSLGMLGTTIALMKQVGDLTETEVVEAEEYRQDAISNRIPPLKI